MSSIGIQTAKSSYAGDTEEETLRLLAKKHGLQRIYKYRSVYSEGIEFTDYKLITTIGDYDEIALFNSDACKDIILVYDRGNVQNLGIRPTSKIKTEGGTISLVGSVFVLILGLLCILLLYFMEFEIRSQESISSHLKGLDLKNLDLESVLEIGFLLVLVLSGITCLIGSLVSLYKIIILKKKWSWFGD